MEDMSGTSPYVYVDVSDNLLSLTGGDIIYIADGDQLGVYGANGADFFEPGCLTGRPLNNEFDSLHPFGAYNINYPYCRVAVEIRMDDPRSNPLVASLVAVAPFLSLKIFISDCSPGDIINVTSKVDAEVRSPCGVVLYPGYVNNEFYVVVDFSAVSLPALFTFTLTNDKGLVKTFMVAIRDSRDGVPPEITYGV